MKLGDMTIKQVAEICETNICRECPFCKDHGSCILLDYIPSKCFGCPFREEVGEDWICIFDDDSDDNVGNKVIDMDEKDFPTNREWMEGLSDEDLAAFYTHGLIIEKYSQFPINIHQIIGSFMSSQSGIKEWLSRPCMYLIEEE